MSVLLSAPGKGYEVPRDVWALVSTNNQFDDAKFTKYNDPIREFINRNGWGWAPNQRVWVEIYVKKEGEYSTSIPVEKVVAMAAFRRLYREVGIVLPNRLTERLIEFNLAAIAKCAENGEGGISVGKIEFTDEQLRKYKGKSKPIE